jgi:hypothetical protein
MKSLLIILGFCAAFIVVSTGDRGLGKPYRIESQENQQCDNTSQDSKRVTANLKQTKTGKLPRWHRLIPGMFR